MGDMLPGMFKFLLLPLLSAWVFLVACDSDPRATADSSRIAFAANENQKVFKGYTLHVNALTTDQLTPEVAREYGITRSKGKAMMNVVISRNEAGGTGTPVTGTVTTVARNLTNQIKDMEMREIVVQDAIYYIGVISVDHEETIVFNMDVTPVDETQPFLISYRQQFFTE